MPAIRHRWTPVDVRALLDESRAWPRFELIGGELLVTPAPRGRHQLAVNELVAILRPFVTAHALGVVFTSPSDLELIAGSVTQPDVFVVPAGAVARGAERWKWADIDRLLLAIEVVSPASVHTDRVTKRDYYMKARVPDYWVVDLDARVVECWQPDRARPRVARELLAWHPAGAPEPLTLGVDELLARIDQQDQLLRGR